MTGDAAKKDAALTIRWTGVLLRTGANGADAQRREAALTKDVDQWIAEGRIPADRRDHYLKLHRSGKAAGIVKYLPRGTFKAPAGGPRAAAPASETRTIARGLVQQARSLDRTGAPKAGAAAPQQTETRSTAKDLIADALTLGRGR